MEKREEMRKGPWTEQEDVQLALYVNLFGDRRWDFIAKVSGLKRTGKSCRLRWVNYLNPGLKREKMTPHEERLLLELHSKWGNRWSRIARKLPGRTDNEIKNYWRTLMRKKAHEKKKVISLSSSSSLSSNSSSSTAQQNSPSSDHVNQAMEAKECSFYDLAGPKKTGMEVEETASMDEIWKEFEFSEENCGRTYLAVASPAPIWDYCPTYDSLWCMGEEARKTMGDDDHFHYFPFYNYFSG